MSRPHNDFVESFDIPPTVIADGLFAGARRHLLSEDDATGASTAALDLPDGWSGRLGARRGSLELLVLAGGLSIGSRELGPHGWAMVPHGMDPGSLSAPAGTRLLCMSDPEDIDAGELSVVDVDRIPWQHGKRGGPGGVAVKTLREGAVVSLIISNVPRYWSGPEFHECPEELFVLVGDVTGRRGSMSPGSYFWRPEFITHGPYWSETGLMVFVRGHGDLYAHWIEDADAKPEHNRAHAAELRKSR